MPTSATSGWRPSERWVAPGRWTPEGITAALRDWTDQTGMPPRIYEWSPRQARALGLYNARCALWEREHPRWPSSSTVLAHQGSWLEALAAAGLPAPPPRRWDLPLSERVDAAHRLRAQGWLQRQIADYLGVEQTTVSGYLTARRCRCGEPIIRSRARQCRRCARRTAQPLQWDRPTILRRYRNWRRDTGRAPVRGDCDSHSACSAEAVADGASVGRTIREPVAPRARGR